MTNANEQHQPNASRAAAAAVDYDEWSAWAEAGADPDEACEPEVVAVSRLPPAEFDLLAAISAAGRSHPTGSKHAPRLQYALGLDSERLAALVAALDAADDGGDDDDDNGEPALRPRPRRKGRGFGY